MTRSIVPNMLTLGNLLCGCVAIGYVIKEEYVTVVILVLVALALDFLDGLVARVLNAQSALGKELDSLADVVSFGVLPGFMMNYLLDQVIPVDSIAAKFGFVLALAAAYRLAKFNIDEGDSPHFSGLPVPAMTVFVFGLYWANFEFITPWASMALYFLVFICLCLSILMLAPIELLSLKSLSKGKLDAYQLVLLLCFAGGIFLFGPLGLSVGIGFYILLSLVKFRILKRS